MRNIPLDSGATVASPAVVRTDIDLELEDVQCDLCGGRDEIRLLDSADYWHGTAGVFHIVKCRNCGLVYVNPRPTRKSIAGYYPGDYYAYVPPGEASAPSARQILKRKIRASRVLSKVARVLPRFREASRDAAIRDDIPEWIPPGVVLDVGCGSGGFLDQMASLGWRTIGIEPSATAADAARARGHAVYCQAATDSLPADLICDLVYVSHTLEHVHSPRRALDGVRGVLRPHTGRLVVEVPNLGSLFTGLFRGLGTALDTPRHLYLFDEATLKRLFVETGFEICAVRQPSGTQQIVKSLALVSRLFPLPLPTDRGSLLDDPELLAALKPLVDLAAARGQGGALRITAKRTGA